MEDVRRLWLSLVAHAQGAVTLRGRTVYVRQLPGDTRWIPWDGTLPREGAWGLALTDKQPLGPRREAESIWEMDKRHWGIIDAYLHPQQLAALACAARAAKRWHTPERPAGVRVWRIREEGRLLPLVFTMGDTWRTDRAEAFCLRNTHTPPADGSETPPCTCGLYAVPAEAVRVLDLYLTNPKRAAVGVVSLSGRVVEHRYGWRAERARIREVWLPDLAFQRLDLANYEGVTWHVWHYYETKAGQVG